MNIFLRIAAADASTDTRLGCRLLDEGARDRRFAAMAAMNPRGFPTPAKKPKVNAQGLTRGQRKEAARQQVVAAIKAERARTLTA